MPFDEHLTALRQNFKWDVMQYAVRNDDESAVARDIQALQEQCRQRFRLAPNRGGIAGRGDQLPEPLRLRLDLCASWKPLEEDLIARQRPAERFRFGKKKRYDR